MKQLCIRTLFILVLLNTPSSFAAVKTGDIDWNLYGHAEFAGAFSNVADHHADENTTAGGAGASGNQNDHMAFYTIDWLGLNFNYSPTERILGSDFELFWEGGIQREVNLSRNDTTFLHRRIEGILGLFDQYMTIRAGIAPKVLAPGLRGHSMNLEKAWVGSVSYRTRTGAPAGVAGIADAGTITYDQLGKMDDNFALIDLTGQPFDDLLWNLFFLRYVGAVASWSGVHTYGADVTYDFMKDMSAFLGFIFHRDKLTGTRPDDEDHIFSLGGQYKAMQIPWNIDLLAELWGQWGRLFATDGTSVRDRQAYKWRLQSARNFNFWKSRLMFSFNGATGEEVSNGGDFEEAHPLAALNGELAEFNSSIHELIEITDAPGSVGPSNFWALMLFWDFTPPCKFLKKEMTHGIRALYKQAWEERVTNSDLPMMLEWRVHTDWPIMKHVTLFQDTGYEHPLHYYKSDTTASATTGNLFAYAGIMADF